jgi:hypothetical protein
MHEQQLLVLGLQVIENIINGEIIDELLIEI